MAGQRSNAAVAPWYVILDENGARKPSSKTWSGRRSLGRAADCQGVGPTHPSVPQRPEVRVQHIPAPSRGTHRFDHRIGLSNDTDPRPESLNMMTKGVLIKLSMALLASAGCGHSPWIDTRAFGIPSRPADCETARGNLSDPPADPVAYQNVGILGVEFSDP